MTLTVRPGTTADHAGVLEVFLGCWHESYQDVLPAQSIADMTQERAAALWTRVLADPSGTVLVAERDGKVVGLTRYACGADGVGAVHSLYVSPQAHGGGIGRHLLSAAVDQLRMTGVREATLWVFADNTRSIGFYEAQGWAPDGTTRVQAEFGALEQRMRRNLA